MGIILAIDVDAMRERSKKASEALSAIRGALIAAENGSDAGAVREILLDCTEIVATEIRALRKVASEQPRQQDLPMPQADARSAGDGQPQVTLVMKPGEPKQLAGKSS